jgi:hypothetical protein
MRAYEFVMKEDWNKGPKVTLKHLRQMKQVERERQVSMDKRRELFPRMYGFENAIDREMREIELQKQRLELRQLEVEIAQTEAETATERAELESDGVEAVRRMSRAEMRRPS